jgi:hypothetical protein
MVRSLKGAGSAAISFSSMAMSPDGRRSSRETAMAA